MKASVRGVVGVCVAGLLWSPSMSRDAHAFGAAWSSDKVPVRHAVEKVIFVDNPGPTITAIIQIEYEGPPQKFAWLIPVRGTPTVGISSNAVFLRLDAATAPEYLVEVAVEGTCKQGGQPKAAPSTDYGSGGATAPYDHVHFGVDPKRGDPLEAATHWLEKNGYAATGADTKALAAYLNEGFDLLAFRLSKGADSRATRPLMLTYEGKLPVVPLRLTSASAVDDMDVQVWLFGPSQAVPVNYRALVLNEARIDWLSGGKFPSGTLPGGGAGSAEPYASKPRNYDGVVSEAANDADGRGFVTELGGPASQYREKVWAPLDEQTFATISKDHYADGIDAITAADRNFHGWDGLSEAILGATTLPAGVTVDELVRDPDRYRGRAKVDVAKFFRLLDEKVVKPVTDTAALFYKAPYLTRLYSKISSAEMTIDPVFDYNGDLAQIGNPRVAKQFIRCSPVLSQSDAPWRMDLPHGGVVQGTGTGWPLGDGSMPANLKIVSLTTSGPGTVIKDNSEDIANKLFNGAGSETSTVVLRPAQNGVSIGGTQTLTRHGEPPSTNRNPAPSRRGKCAIASVGAATGSAMAEWLPLSVLLLARRRYRRRLGALERVS